MSPLAWFAIIVAGYYLLTGSNASAQASTSSTNGLATAFANLAKSITGATTSAKPASGGSSSPGTATSTGGSDAGSGFNVASWLAGNSAADQASVSTIDASPLTSILDTTTPTDSTPFTWTPTTANSDPTSTTDTSGDTYDDGSGGDGGGGDSDALANYYDTGDDYSQ
jgi:hypothetical protein